MRNIASLLEIFILLSSVFSNGGKLLTQKKEKTIYDRNLKGCNDRFLDTFLGPKRKQPNTAKAKEICADIQVSCCDAGDMQEKLKEMEHAKNVMKGQLNYMNEFLDFVSRLPVEEFLTEVKKIKMKTEEEQTKLIETYRSLIKSDAEGSKSNLVMFFNGVVKSYSGLICLACDDRFGEFFWKTEPKLSINEYQCYDTLEDSYKFMSIGSQIEMLLQIANLIETPSSDEFDHKKFADELAFKMKLAKNCLPPERDEFADDGVQSISELSNPNLDEDRTIQPPECDSICRNNLPFAPFILPFNPVPQMKYIESVLGKRFKKEVPVVDEPNLTPLVFFRNVFGADGDKKVILQENSLYFKAFSVIEKEYEIVKLPEMKENDIPEEDLIPRKPLSIWKRLYNFLFGWFAEPYTVYDQ